jgi:hypothetical protein
VDRGTSLVHLNLDSSTQKSKVKARFYSGYWISKITKACEIMLLNRREITMHWYMSKQMFNLEEFASHALFDAIETISIRL